MNTDHPILIEVGKLKHKRIISITTLIITILGAGIVGVIFNDNFYLYDVPREYFLSGLVVLAITILVFQNSKLNKLEEIMGWKKEIEEGKMNLLARLLQKISAKFKEWGLNPAWVIDGIISLAFIIFLEWNFLTSPFEQLRWAGIILLIGMIVIAIFVFGMDWLKSRKSN